MSTYKNGSDQTFIFPSLGLIVEPGASFDTDSDITTEGVVAVSASAKKSAPVAAPVDPAPAVDAPVVDPAPVDPAVAPETPAPVEEVK